MPISSEWVPFSRHGVLDQKGNPTQNPETANRFAVILSMLTQKCPTVLLPMCVHRRVLAVHFLSFAQRTSASFILFKAEKMFRLCEFQGQPTSPFPCLHTDRLKLGALSTLRCNMPEKTDPPKLILLLLHWPLHTHFPDSQSWDPFTNFSSESTKISC